MLVRFVLLVPALLQSASALATGAAKLRRTLSRGRPLIVEVTQPDPEGAWSLDVTETSEQLRDAGATALVVPPELLRMVIDEQLSAKGGFPEPLPVFCSLDSLEDPSDVAGAAGVVVRCTGGAQQSGFEELSAQVRGADLPLIVIAESSSAHTAAAAAGAVAVVCDYPSESAGGAAAGASATADEGVEVPLVLGAWGGDEDEMYSMREVGFEGMLLIDGCVGDIGDGRAWCESRVRLFRSKASRQWGGSMFGATSEDTTPQQRNPRLCVLLPCLLRKTLSRLLFAPRIPPRSASQLPHSDARLELRCAQLPH